MLMLTVLLLEDSQSFGWNNCNIITKINFIQSIDEFIKSPSPKIVLISSKKQWYEFDRNHNSDLNVYWTSEALANASDVQ